MRRASELRPIGDRILVRPDARLAVSAGGLHIPPSVLADNPNYFSMTGVVVALGDGRRYETWACVHCGQEIEQVGGPHGVCPCCTWSMTLANSRLSVAGEDIRPFDVQIGDRVLFNRFKGKQVEVAGDVRHLVMRESDLLGIVEGEHRILPGYEPPPVGRLTEGLSPALPVR